MTAKIQVRLMLPRIVRCDTAIVKRGQRIPPVSLRSRAGMTRVWGGYVHFRGVYFRGYGCSRNGAYFLDSDFGGWNDLVVAEVAELSPFRPVVGGGFCVLGGCFTVGNGE